LRDCFALADERNFDQDPRHGLIVLSEIASRALSPAVNDPGTAIYVLDAGARVIESYLGCRQQAEAEVCTRVFADDLDTEALLFEFFNPIARDGAAMIEVQIQIQNVLQSSATHAGNDALAMHARAEASAARMRAMDKLESPRDQAALTRACLWLQ
jgi:Predicted membrane protein